MRGEVVGRQVVIAGRFKSRLTYRRLWVLHRNIHALYKPFLAGKPDEYYGEDGWRGKEGRLILNKSVIMKGLASSCVFAVLENTPRIPSHCSESRHPDAPRAQPRDRLRAGRRSPHVSVHLGSRIVHQFRPQGRVQPIAPIALT